MLFYRHKIMLSLIQQLGGKASATDFQKYLFLFTRMCEHEKSYDFVPYKYGCYSFQAAADKNSLLEKGYLLDDSCWELADKRKNYSRAISANDAKKVALFVDRYKSYKGKGLVQLVYREYPYYAINSHIAEDYLNQEELMAVESARPKKRRKPILATIGYEGGSIEDYINRLIDNDIRTLVDVRKNPISRKYGFSKKTLSSLLSRLGIEYLHLPDLGIESEDRKNLETQKDYDRLFSNYEKTVLSVQKDAIQKLSDVYFNQRRIALTCFEKDHKQCHRSRLANKFVKDSDSEIQLVHL